MHDFDFRQLFIFDLANNHQGDLEHGLAIIHGVGTVARQAGIRAAFKFQFRDLDTFIHPDYKERQDVKHIPRFLATRLGPNEWMTLTKAVRAAGMLTICTPFDEPSVDHIVELGIDIIKIASCSAGDRPLLGRAASVGKPMVVSTAGLTGSQIDNLVSFLEFKHAHFALMHCVAVYPTSMEKMQLNQISMLKSRYPRIPIGFSTHEAPENLTPIGLAYAKGAELFERHVGLEERGHKINAYSSTPEQIAAWLEAYREAVSTCGGTGRAPAPVEEATSLRSLMRGVYAQRPISKGAALSREDVFFAMPLTEDQLPSGQFFAGMRADRDYAVNDLIHEGLDDSKPPDSETIYQILLQVKGMLNMARIFIGRESAVEISHHYGLTRFREFGAVIITCINRAYCKKLVIQLPRQKHPYHFHKQKEETFQLLYGDLHVERDGRKYDLQPGDTILVEPEQWHKFSTLNGAIFEEVSTTHFTNDSFYDDRQIKKLPVDARKTHISALELGLDEHFR